MENAVQLLDCTLRDGGLCMEDAAVKGWSTAMFTGQEIAELICWLRQTSIDIIELGSIEISHSDKRPYAIYPDVEAISETIPADRAPDQMYVALFRGPDTPAAEIPAYRPGLCQGLRVILRYSELQKSLEFCKALAEKGYLVFVQPMLTMRYTEEELDELIRAANEMRAYALYIVDSYGYMDSADLQRLFQKYDAGLSPQIRIGFHAHDNMNLAYSNARSFLEHRGKREVIIDSCVMGIGQGAGNLQTEIIAHHLNTAEGKHYRYDAVLEACEIIETFWKETLWGYSVTRLLPAIHRTAYKYALSLRKQYGFSFVEIHHFLEKLPMELRQRYTAENLALLLHEQGYKT